MADDFLGSTAFGSKLTTIDFVGVQLADMVRLSNAALAATITFMARTSLHRGHSMHTLAFAALLAITCPVAAATPTPIADAERWLALVDSGHYAESWADAGKVFRRSIAQNAWSTMVKPVRKPLGTVLSRTLLTETKATSLPGQPDGEYEVVQFSTTFANKKAAVETVSLTFQPDGWRVDGYFVK